jgi:hypothetical protein
MELALGVPRKEGYAAFGQDAESKDDQANNGGYAS